MVAYEEAKVEACTPILLLDGIIIQLRELVRSTPTKMSILLSMAKRQPMKSSRAVIPGHQSCPSAIIWPSVLVVHGKCKIKR